MFELIRFYRQYKDARIAENLSQRELLKRELKLIGTAILVAAAIMALLIGLAQRLR